MEHHPQHTRLDRFETIELLLEHYQHPQHSGPLPNADIRMPGHTPGCGDTLLLYIKLSEDGTRVQQCSFEGDGCTISQATASMLAAQVQGMALNEIAGLDVFACFPELDPDVLRSRIRCATLALRTLKAAVAGVPVDVADVAA